MGLMTQEERDRLRALADIIGAVHAPEADPRFHESDARLLRRIADAAQDDLRGRELAALYDALRQALDGLDGGSLRDYVEDALRRAERYREQITEAA